jgi:universal stress protein A
MFKHILVPTDLTEKSSKALRIAAQMPFDDICKITLLHVIETIEEGDDDEFDEFYQKLMLRAQAKMDAIISGYEGRRPLIEKSIVYGNRVKEIITFAQQKEIDLIVLSSHKIEKEDISRGWGTISYRVGILAHCPVMMVK